VLYSLLFHSSKRYDGIILNEAVEDGGGDKQESKKGFRDFVKNNAFL
jgi:hypothetical protein